MPAYPPAPSGKRQTTALMQAVASSSEASATDTYPLPGESCCRQSLGFSCLAPSVSFSLSHPLNSNSHTHTHTHTLPYLLTSFSLPVPILSESMSRPLLFQRAFKSSSLTTPTSNVPDCPSPAPPANLTAGVAIGPFSYHSINVAPS